METVDVTFVRIYVMESDFLPNSVISYLKNEAKIRGISVFRAVSGFGETGMHSGTSVDPTPNLPLAIEFFDHKDKVEIALKYLSNTIKNNHIVFWDAKANNGP